MRVIVEKDWSIHSDNMHSVTSSIEKERIA